MLRRHRPDGERIVRGVLQNLDRAVLFGKVVFHLIEPRADLFCRLVGDERVLVAERIIRLELFDFRRDEFVLIRLSDDAQDRLVELVAFDLVHALHAFVQQVDHAVGDLFVELIESRFVFRRKILNGVDEQLRRGELFGRRADQREPSAAGIVSDFDAGHGAFHVVLDGAGNVAFDVQVEDAVLLGARRALDHGEVRLHAVDGGLFPKDEHTLIRSVVGRRRQALNTRQRGNDLCRELFLQRIDFQNDVELSVQTRAQLNRRLDRRLRAVNDQRGSRVVDRNVKTRYRVQQ